MMGNHDKRNELKKYVKSDLIDQYGNLNYTISDYSLEIICLEQQDNKFQNGLWKIDFD